MNVVVVGVTVAVVTVVVTVEAVEMMGGGKGFAENWDLIATGSTEERGGTGDIGGIVDTASMVGIADRGSTEGRGRYFREERAVPTPADEGTVRTRSRIAGNVRVALFSFGCAQKQKRLKTTNEKKFFFRN